MTQQDKLTAVIKFYFKDQSKAAALTKELTNIKAKVDKNIEEMDDRRGNVAMVKQQTVKSNVPESFQIDISIFKGLPKTTIEIEVDIDVYSDKLLCSLISPQANDQVIAVTDQAIDQQLEKIKDLCPEIAIIEG